MFCISINHKNTPADVRESFAFSTKGQRQFTERLKAAVVAKASAIVVWAAFLAILAIISGIVTLVSGDSKLIAVVMMIVGIVVPVVMFMGAAKNRA